MRATIKNTLKTLTLSFILTAARMAGAEENAAFQELLRTRSVEFESGIRKDMKPAPRDKKSKTLLVHSESLDIYKNPESAFQFNPGESLKKHGHTAAAILDVSAERNNPVVDFRTSLIDHAFFDFNATSKIILRGADILSVSSYQSLFYARPPFNVKDANEAWDTSRTIAVIGLPNQDAENILSPEGFNVFDRADTVIRTVSYKNAGFELSPDVIYPTAFDEGFCYKFIPSMEEIEKLFEGNDVPEFARENREEIYKDANYYRRKGGIPSCRLEGNSFASPNLAGLIAAQKENYQDLNDHEITAALLTAGKSVGAQQYYSRNARGLKFGSIAYGFGLVTKENFKKNLETLREIRAQHPASETQAMRQDTKVTMNADGISAKAAFDGKASVMRAMGILTVRNNPAVFRPEMLRDNLVYTVKTLPSEARITSPAGTVYNVKIHADAADLAHPENGIKFGFSTSGFLGESAEGTWKIELAQGRRPPMKLLSAEFTIAGMKPGSAVDALITSLTAPPPQPAM